MLAFKRQSLRGETPWTVFKGGFVAFLLAVFEGEIKNPFSDASFPQSPHSFTSWREIGGDWPS